MRIAFVALAIIVSVRTARADQCQWLADPAMAARAAQEALQRAEVVSFCEPCGDPPPGEPRRVTSAGVRPLPDNAAETLINGEAVDLAYIYVKTSDRRYHNLADLVGCPASGVSLSLVVDAVTPTGVLIRADRAAPLTAPVAAASTAAFAPPRAIDPGVTIVLSPPPPEPAGQWLPAALAGVLASLAALALLAAWCIARHRQHHVPRAANLTLRG